MNAQAEAILRWIVRESDRAAAGARLDPGTGDVIVPREAWRRARAAVLAAASEYGIEQEEGQ